MIAQNKGYAYENPLPTAAHERVVTERLKFVAALGASGWEMVGADTFGLTLFFKRPLVD